MLLKSRIVRLGQSAAKLVAMRIRNPRAWLTRRWQALARWSRRHAVVLAGLALIAGQLAWTWYLLRQSYFRQTDFLLLDRALREGFGWKYLMSVNQGHLMPIGMALTWAMARISLYDWALASAVVMVLTAAASLAMLRMLRTVFTDEPAILFPLAVYLFLPLSAGATAWLSVALRVLPFQVAMFLAVHAHVRYLRGRRVWQLVASAIWVLAAMAATDQGALLPVLLFALTAAYFVPGRRDPVRPSPAGRGAVRQALARYWRAWLLYGGLLAAYCVVFFIQLSGSGGHIPGPGKATSLYQFAGTVLGAGLIPGLVGGPWEWATAGYAQAAPPAAAEYLSWLIVAAVVVVSCFYRSRAWRAWAIVLGWVVAACVVPVALGGFGLPVTTLGQQTGYLANATGVVALGLALAFLPADGTAAAAPRSLRVAGLLAFCCFAAGTLASLQDFAVVAGAGATRAYIANARLAVARAPRGTLIVDAPTPPAVVAGGFFSAQFSGQADTATVIGPLAGDKGDKGSKGSNVSWVRQLNGVYDGQGPMIFGPTGVLRPVTVHGLRSTPPHGRKDARPACWNATSAVTSIRLGGTLYRWPWIVRLTYTGPAGTLGVTFGNAGQSIAVPAGAHVAYLTVTGSGGAIGVQFYPGAGSAPLCISGVTVGLAGP
jgi:hypothetical protein